MDAAWIEFGQVAAAHLLAVASPGPDFAIVVRQSLAYGRRTAVWTSAGVGTAILLHVGYSLLGIGLLIKGSAVWFTVVKCAGAAYLAWLGLRSLRSKPRGLEEPGPVVAIARPSARSAFIAGFLTNALNPKATLFFVALFITVIRPDTSRLIQLGYGIWMAVVTTTWFTGVAFLFTRAAVRQRFLLSGHWIDRVLGILFIGFAVSLALAARV